MSLRSLQEKITRRFPKAIVKLDETADANGSSFLDARLDDHSVTIEWRKRNGFGISARSDIAYGEGVDESYKSEDDAFRRIASLFLSRTKTTPPREVRLRELRETAGLSQIELANLMSIQQATVSKLEQGRDLRTSTLTSLISAMGAELSIAVRFPDGREQRLDVAALMGKK